MSKPRIAVSVIVHNESAELAGCLTSIRGLADEIVVVDCASSDGSARVARRAGARVYRRPNLENLNVNKAYGIARTRAPWVLYLDPDERMTPALAREIKAVIRRPDAAAAYEIPRRNFYFGRWLRRGGKYPDTQRRLFRRDRARFAERHVHERLQVTGAVGRLVAPFDHHPYRTMESFLRKADFYAAFQAKYLAQRGARAGIWNGFLYCGWLPVTRFIRRYFFKLGFLDGLPGFLGCLHDTLTQVLTYAHLANISSPA